MQGRDPSSRQADRTLPASSGAPESGVHHAGSHQTDHQHAAHHNGDRGSSAHQTILSIVAADDAAEQPQLLEECRSGERSSAAVLGHQGAGDIHGRDSKDDGVVSGVENGEVGTLLRVIGQAGLSRLGNDALAGVADDVQPFRFLKVCHGP